MTSPDFPEVPASSLLSAAPKDVAPSAADQLPTAFEELEEFSPEAHKPIRPEARLKKPLPLWIAGSRGIFLGLGMGVLLTLGAVKLVSSGHATPSGGAASAPAVVKGQSVTVVAVEPAMVTETITANGTVTARNLLPVAAATSGLKIRQVLVNEGDQVEAGQVLAQLDNAVLLAQLRQATASLRSAQSVVQQKQAVLVQTQASFNLAQSNVRRYEQLATQGAVSRQDLETQTTTAANDRAAMSVAQADIDSARSDALSRQAQVQQLQTQIGQTAVMAPASGLVAEKLAEVGDVTGSGKLFSIIQNGALELDALVSADQLPRIKIGALVHVSSASNGQIQSQGTVREIAPLVNDQTRQATVKIDLQPSGQLRPGLFLNAKIAAQTTPGLTIPAKAVLPQPDGSSMVFVLSGDKAKATSVQVGAIQAGSDSASAYIAVTSGLAAGDRVIVSGAGYLKDGDSVTVVTAQATPSPVSP